MIIGIPKEIKNNEERVAITPEGVKTVCEKGHRVIIEKNAGLGSGITNEDFKLAGAEIYDSAEKIWQTADLILKIKEPVNQEIDYLKYLNNKILFTYLHLSGVEKRLTEALIQNNVTAIAYETVEDENGKLPLLAPMSEVAAILAIQQGAEYLMRKHKGRGVTLGKITGIAPAMVVIIGGGTAGQKAAMTAAGMGANVVLLQRAGKTFDNLSSYFSSFDNVKIVESIPENLELYIREADLLIGAVLIRGATAPKLITAEMIKKMNTGSVFVDISIDQGGSSEISKCTSHSQPIFYTDNGVIIYCVPNMPAQAARQSTFALTTQTLPYLYKLLDEGFLDAMKNDEGFKKGLNIYNGHITYEAVARDLRMTEFYQPLV